MKKTFIKFMMMLAIALPTVMMTSCSDDDDEDTPKEPETTVTVEDMKLDGEAFVKRNWLQYDENGNVTGTTYGKALDASEPTVVYIGVKDIEEAMLHFMFRITPVLVNIVDGEGDNMEAILKDTQGNEQNRILFTALDEGNVIANVKLQKNIGIEKYITEFRYIPKSLWPENAIMDMPFKVGGIYTFKGRNYVCMSEPECGNNGLLVCDRNEEWEIATWTQSGTEKATANFPNVNTVLQICQDMNSNGMHDKMWKLLCAASGQADMKKLKEREYWTSTVDGDDILVVNLANIDKRYFMDTTNSVGFSGIAWLGFIQSLVTDFTKKHTLDVYKFYVDSYGVVKMKKANNNIWMDAVEDPYPSVSNFNRNVELERKAETIQYQ